MRTAPPVISTGRTVRIGQSRDGYRSTGLLDEIGEPREGTGSHRRVRGSRSQRHGPAAIAQAAERSAAISARSSIFGGDPRDVERARRHRLAALALAPARDAVAIGGRWAVAFDVRRIAHSAMADG